MDKFYMIMVSFGKNLKKVRSEKGISQGDLAKMIGMHPTHISRYERDLTSPTAEVIRKISNKLNISADLLLFGSYDEKAQSRIKDNELLNMFNKVQKLNKDEIHCIKSLLNAYLLKSNLQQQLTT